MQYSLPGVFENNPSPEVNGSLWTIPFEIGCYAILAGLMISGAIKRPGQVLLFTYTALIVGIPLRLVASHVLGDHLSFMEILATQIFFSFGSLLWPSFLIGIVLYQLRYYVPFSKTLAIGLVCAAILVGVVVDAADLSGHPAIFSIMLPLLGYLTVVIGLSPMPRLPGFGAGDYSYGLYLYHTPFLQLLIHYFPQVWIGERWWTLFFAGFPLTLGAAVVSWHVFEYPSLKLRKSFAIKHRPEGSFGGFEDRAARRQAASRAAPLSG
jgi:peptidoglycan/LPS O-acetylase OafA/YrhL